MLLLTARPMGNALTPSPSDRRRVAAVSALASRAVYLAVLAVLACLLVVASGARVQAQYGPGARQATRGQGGPLLVGEGRLIRLPRPAATVLLADPSIADLQTPTADQVFLFGKKPGRTSLVVLDAAGHRLLNQRVVVGYSDEDLRDLIRAEVGNLPVSLTYTPSGGVLSGTVPSPKDAERVRAIASRFLGEGAVLVNNLVVTGALQVNLRVRVAEVSRSVSKELGINWDAVGASGNFAFGLLTGRAVLDAAGAVARSATNAGALFGRYSSGRNSVTGLIDALASENLVTILAEPNLVAVSGEPASFLAGGEFPVPVAQGLDRISIEYRRFGVTLEFQPTVLSDDLINLRVRPEVSELTDAGSIRANGFSIPGISARRADTTVELGSGQSFAIAGLLQNGFTTGLDRYPILGDIPILGALFRSTRFRRNETELVIIVTPYIVRPAASAAALRAPTDQVAAPSDVELLLGARLARPGQQSGPARLHGDFGFVLE